MSLNPLFRLIGMLAAGCFAPLALAQPITATVLRTFTGRPDGDSPSTNLAQAAEGTLYGFTALGGTADAGALFRLRPDGTGYAVVSSFPAGATAVNTPEPAMVLGLDGALYGITSYGGPSGGGAIFRVSTTGGAVTLLRAFSNASTAERHPWRTLVQGPDGTLFGITSDDSAADPLGNPRPSSSGVVFRLRPDGSGYQVLHAFPNVPAPRDGQNPTSLILGRDGRLYGTTLNGGLNAVPANSPGAIFSMRTDGSDYTLVRSFSNATGDAIAPDGPLVHAANGTLYGTTTQGGAFSRGTIFRVNPDGSAFSVIYSFPGGAAGVQRPRLVFFQGSDGLLYGVASGNGADENVLYRVRTDGTGFQVITPSNVPSGFFTLMQAPDGVFYGTTASFDHRGSVFRLGEITGGGGGGVSTSSRLVNLSILTSLAGASDSFTMGYVVGGAGTSGQKPLVIRAAGPSLTPLGVGGALTDPQLTLFAGTTQSGANDNWGGGATLLAAMNGVGAFPFASPTSLDAAVATSVAAGDNSVKVAPVGNLSGQVIAEIYDATPDSNFTAATPRLVNVSVLKNIGTSLTAGFVIRGTGSRTVLIRAIGPTLGAAPFNVPGVVTDPQLALFNAAGAKVGENDNWGGAAALTAAFTSVGAFQLSGPNSRDAALLATLAPGNYTVQVSGVGGTTGTALVEVYEVP